MDWLAERSQLEVEYMEEEVEFDEALLEKLAEESLQREQSAAAAGPGKAPAVMDAEIVEPTAAAQSDDTKRT